MARIHRRAAGTWEVVLELGRDLQTGKRLRRTFTVKGTKKQAEVAAATQEAAIAGGTFVDPSGRVVTDVVERSEPLGKSDDVPMLLTVKDVESALQLGRTRTYELVRSGELPVIRIGRAVRIPRDALRRWVEAQVAAVQPSDGIRWP